MPVIVFCNPLFDIVIGHGSPLINEYNLKENSAILASNKTSNLKEKAMESKPVLIPGGSGLNTARCVQALLPKQSVSYLGAIGDDNNGTILRNQCQELGINLFFQTKQSTSTGTCVVLLNKINNTRTMVAELSAAIQFTYEEFVTNQDIFNCIKDADIAYVTGFSLSTSFETVRFFADAWKEKIFALNLSAEFLIEQYLENFVFLFPYVKLLFGNIDEFSLLFKKLITDTCQMTNASVPDIEGYSKKLLFSLQEFSTGYSLMNVIITNGKNPTLFALNGNIRYEPVENILYEEIIDTVGAGDAFAAGVICNCLAKKDMSECVKLGNELASKILKVSGVPFDLPFSSQSNKQ